MNKIRVLIADDHPMVADGLELLLNRQEDMVCIGKTGTGTESISRTKHLRPHIVLLDIALPDINGIEVAKQIKTACTDVRIIMMTAYGHHYYVTACIQLGVEGYLLKSVIHSDIVKAIRNVHDGKTVYCSEVTGTVLKGMAKKPAITLNRKTLHNREIEILQLAAQGMANKQIADRLGISIHTVSSHFVNIFRKLDVASRTEAVTYGLTAGWYTLDRVE